MIGKSSSSSILINLHKANLVPLVGVDLYCPLFILSIVWKLSPLFWTKNTNPSRFSPNQEFKSFTFIMRFIAAYDTIKPFDARRFTNINPFKRLNAVWYL